MAGVKAADPVLAVQKSLRIHDGQLEIIFDGRVCSKPWGKIHLIAFGKAACKMAEAACEVIPDSMLEGSRLVVTNYENQTTVEGCEVMVAGHPLPDASGVDAAQAVIERLECAQLDELVLVLVSGGGSALLTCPVVPLTLDDKIVTTELLLASGADIQQLNCVRKHLSRLKGGGLAQIASPADVHALILSDVIGDDPSSIASGPTVPDSTCFADAIKVLRGKHIWDKVPKRVREHLQAGGAGKIPETAKPGDSIFDRVDYTLIGSNSISVNAVQQAASAEGYTTQVYTNALCGEARDEAEKLVVYAAEQVNTLEKPLAIIAGGETTVTLKGDGQGGRNQEFALAFAIAAERHGLKSRWVLLSGGTDGRDGPTDAAGGLVDSGSFLRISETGVDAQIFLDNNDSYLALKGSGDLLDIGATGTNVADLQVLLVQV